jgi:hypothetical protein
MKLAVALAVIAIASPAAAAAPGEGTRFWLEVGGGAYNGTYTASTATESGRGGVSGPMIRARTGFGFPIARGLIVGPSLGLDWAFTSSAASLCCGTIERIDTSRVGVEAAYYLDPNVGFRIQAGFGYALTSLHRDDDARAHPGVLGSAHPRGAYFTAAIARDYAIAARTRLGGVLRVESEALTGRSGDHIYGLRTFTPTLSLVLVTHWPG